MCAQLRPTDIINSTGARLGMEASLAPCQLSLTHLHSVHSHLQDPHQLTAAMQAVLQDVIKGDVAQGRKQRRVFLTGS